MRPLRCIDCSRVVACAASDAQTLTACSPSTQHSSTPLRSYTAPPETHLLYDLLGSRFADQLDKAQLLVPTTHCFPPATLDASNPQSSQVLYDLLGDRFADQLDKVQLLMHTPHCRPLTITPADP